LGKGRLVVKEQANMLGISIGAFDNYSVLTRYPSVIRSFEEGLDYSFLRVKKLVLKIEKAYKEQYAKVLNVIDKRKIDKKIYTALRGEKYKKPTTSDFSCKLNGISSPEGLRILLKENIFEMDAGIDWDALDWQDVDSVNKAISKVINKLNQPHN
jgi:hypothetical protein